MMMTIQFNTDSNIDLSEKNRVHFNGLISEGLSRFRHQITRVEAHLSDEDGNKKGINDKRCLIEARFEGRKPIAVTNNANTHDQAVEGAIDKMKTSLDSMIGRLNDHKKM